MSKAIQESLISFSINSSRKTTFWTGHRRGRTVNFQVALSFGHSISIKPTTNSAPFCISYRKTQLLQSMVILSSSQVLTRQAVVAPAYCSDCLIRLQWNWRSRYQLYPVQNCQRGTSFLQKASLSFWINFLQWSFTSFKISLKRIARAFSAETRDFAVALFCHRPYVYEFVAKLTHTST